MAQHQFSSSPIPTQVELPACPTCGTQMQIARIMPDEPDHDRRTFECPRCHQEKEMVVKFR